MYLGFHNVTSTLVVNQHINTSSKFSTKFLNFSHKKSLKNFSDQVVLSHMIVYVAVNFYFQLIFCF